MSDDDLINPKLILWMSAMRDGDDVLLEGFDEDGVVVERRMCTKDPSIREMLNLDDGR